MIIRILTAANDEMVSGFVQQGIWEDITHIVLPALSSVPDLEAAVERSSPSLIAFCSSPRPSSASASVPILCNQLKEGDVALPFGRLLLELLGTCLANRPPGTSTQVPSAQVPISLLQQLCSMYEDDSLMHMVEDSSYTDLVTQVARACIDSGRGAEVTSLLLKSLEKCRPAGSSRWQQVLSILTTNCSKATAGQLRWLGSSSNTQDARLLCKAVHALAEANFMCFPMIQLCKAALDQGQDLETGHLEFTRELASNNDYTLLRYLHLYHSTLSSDSSEQHSKTLAIMLRLLPPALPPRGLPQGLLEVASYAVHNCIHDPPQLSLPDLHKLHLFLAAFQSRAHETEAVQPEHAAGTITSSEYSPASPSLLTMYIQGLVAAAGAPQTDAGAVGVHINAVTSSMQRNASMSESIRHILVDNCLPQLWAIVAEALAEGREGTAPFSSLEEALAAAEPHHKVQSACTKLLTKALGLATHQAQALLFAVNHVMGASEPGSKNQDADSVLFQSTPTPEQVANVEYFSSLEPAHSLLPHQLTQPEQFAQATQYVLRLRSRHDSTGQLRADFPRRGQGSTGDSNDSTSPSRMILTPTTRENLERVMLAIQSHAAQLVLLQGETDVGKSATVMHAAALSKQPIIRFNLSSSTTIDELLGHISLQTEADSGTDQVVQQLGPFAHAFTSGSVLLLDELNLAPDDVLRCIEQALDTGSLLLPNPASSSEPVSVIQRAAGFHLFATQNPASGGFLGARERLSPALLDRFVPLVFKALPMEELQQVVEETLIRRGATARQARRLAKFLLQVHRKVDEAVKSSQPAFPEASGSYAEITIRELLKCTMMMPLDNSTLRDLDVAQQAPAPLTLAAIQVYAARFRSTLARNTIMAAIAQALIGWDPHAVLSSQVTWRIYSASLGLTPPTAAGMRS